MPRVVSLIASATETVCALGLEGQLVGRSHECDYPPTVRSLPVCTGPRFDVSGSSAEIDRRVKEALQESPSVYRIDGELLRQLRPDVIVTQSQCDVCAVPESDVERAIAKWPGPRPKVVSLEINDLNDLWRNIERLGWALEAPRESVELVERLRLRIAAIEARTIGLLDTPTVACIEWIEPLMAAGLWVPDLVAKAGGIDVFGKSARRGPSLSWEQLRTTDPAVMVVMPCGWDIERARQDMPRLTRQPGWADLKAVPNRRVFLTDGNQYFNRPGPRLVESVEILAEILHPDIFHFGHKGTGWQRYDQGDAT